MNIGISIVVPTYNRPDMTRRAVESCLRGAKESRLPVEVIVRDNCSTVSIRQLEEYCELNDARFIRAASNEGPLANWIKAVQIASYPVVHLLFSDDFVSVYRFSDRDILQLATKQVPFVMLSVNMYDEAMAQVVRSNIYHGVPTDNRIWLHSLIVGSPCVPVSPTAALFNREQMLAALIEFMTQFAFGADNGAGPDIYCYARALESVGANPIISRDSAVNFCAHAGSFSSGAATGNKVIANYSLTRMHVSRNISKRRPVTRWAQMFRIGVKFGIWYKHYVYKIPAGFFGKIREHSSGFESAFVLFGICFGAITASCSYFTRKCRAWVRAFASV